MKKIILANLLIYSLFVQAQNTTKADAELKGSFGLEVAQDYFIDWWPNKNFDRNYTQGTSFSYTKMDLHKNVFFLPLNLLTNLTDKVNDESKDNETGKQYFTDYPSRITMGVTAFTPREIDKDTPIIGDRPFANVIFFSTTRYRVKTSESARISANSYIKTTFSYGLIGTNLANTFQSYAHKSIVKGRPVDISWHHQISRGGKFAFLFSHQVTKTILDKSQDTEKLFLLIKDSLKTKADTIKAKKDIQDKPLWRLTGSLSYNMDIGWYSSVGSTLTFRGGKFSRYTTLDLNSPLNVANKKEGKALNTLPKRKEGYFFASFAPRMTPYNALILGQPFVKSEYTLKYEEYNPFVLDIKYGIVFSSMRLSTQPGMQPLSRWDIIVSLNHRSAEIRNAQYKRWHHWGEISFNFPFL